MALSLNTGFVRTVYTKKAVDSSGDGVISSKLLKGQLTDEKSCTSETPEMDVVSLCLILALLGYIYYIHQRGAVPGQDSVKEQTLTKEKERMR